MLTADSGGPPSWLIDLGVQLAAGLVTMALTLFIQARWIPSPRPRPGTSDSPRADQPVPTEPAAAGADASVAGMSTRGDASPAIMGDGNAAASGAGSAVATGAGSAAVSGNSNTVVAGGGSIYNVSTVYNRVADQGGNDGSAGSLGWAALAAGAAILLSMWWPVLVAACYGAALALIIMLLVAILRSVRYLNRWPAGSALRVLTTGTLVGALAVLVAWLQLAPFGGPRFSDLSAALAQGVRTGLDEGSSPVTAAVDAMFALGTGALVLFYGTLAIVIWAALAAIVRGALMSWLSFLRLAGPRKANQKDLNRAAQATWKQGSIELLAVLVGCAMSLFLASGVLAMLAST